jgi:hypothetical protein
MNVDQTLPVTTDGHSLPLQDYRKGEVEMATKQRWHTNPSSSLDGTLVGTPVNPINKKALKNQGLLLW